MQNIDLICVGKLNAKYFAEGVAEYQKRLSAFASFRIIELPEEKIEAVTNHLHRYSRPFCS
jgi:23S rRNA (pseudouridine1915-N3)-methyltransferase